VQHEGSLQFQYALPAGPDEGGWEEQEDVVGSSEGGVRCGMHACLLRLQVFVLNTDSLGQSVASF
jgi:hypothetical protein